MTIRIEIDLSDDLAEHFAFLLREFNAQAISRGEEPWTPSELGASIIREVVVDDVKFNGPHIDMVH